MSQIDNLPTTNEWEKEMTLNKGKWPTVWPKQRKKIENNWAFDIACKDCFHLRADEACSKGLGGFDRTGKQNKMDTNSKRMCAWYQAKERAVINYQAELKEISGYLDRCGISECDHHIILNKLKVNPDAHVRYLNQARLNSS